MNQQIQPFKLTPDDMLDLDAKTRRGLQPLLDALNATFNQLVFFAQMQPDWDVVQIPLVTDATLSAAFPLKFRTRVTQPKLVVLGNLLPKDPAHLLTTPFVMQGFNLTEAGLVSVPWITGVLASNSYIATFLVR